MSISFLVRRSYPLFNRTFPATGRNRIAPVMHSGYVCGMKITNMTTSRTILISGSSIAGPVLAYWLKAYGFTPTIVEKASSLRKGGYKIDIRGRATEIVKKMGVYEKICQAQVDMLGASFVNDNGKREIGRAHV